MPRFHSTHSKVTGVRAKQKMTGWESLEQTPYLSSFRVLAQLVEGATVIGHDCDGIVTLLTPYSKIYPRPMESWFTGITIASSMLTCGGRVAIRTAACAS